VDTYPTGAQALQRDWPDAQFNVSGMFAFDDLLLQFIDLVRRTLNCRLPIVSLHGAPAVPWNAGRLVRHPFDLQQLPATLDKLAALGLGCHLTFTNHLLTASDLQDPAGNFLLDCLARRPDLNTVIINSELLSQHIARRYPNLRQVASITKVVVEKGRGNVAYYQQLGRRFYRYVVHPDDVHDPRLLDQLDREQAEIIINECCNRQCALRSRHYDLVAQAQKSPASPARPPICLQPPDAPELASDTTRTCELAHSEMKALYDMGFRNFKLQGRAASFYVVAFDLVHFLLEPDFAAPAIYRRVLKTPAFLRPAGSAPVHSPPPAKPQITFQLPARQ
jgi:hypothetical protein